MPSTRSVAAGHRRDAADHPHGRALAGPVGTEEPERLPGPNVEVDAVDGGERPEPLGQPAGVDQGTAVDRHPLRLWGSDLTSSGARRAAPRAPPRRTERGDEGARCDRCLGAAVDPRRHRQRRSGRRADEHDNGRHRGITKGLGAADIPRTDLSEPQIVAIVRAEIADRQSAAADYDRLGQHDGAERLRPEAALLRNI